jgi:hypothetical protein
VVLEFTVFCLNIRLDRGWFGYDCHANKDYCTLQVGDLFFFYLTIWFFEKWILIIKSSSSTTIDIFLVLLTFEIY